MRAKNRLTDTISDRIIDRTMDPSAKKIVDRKKFLKKRRAEIDSELRAIEAVLNVIGLVDYSDGVIFAQERRYEEKRLFCGMSLTEACLIVLDDSGGWLDKNQIEYLLLIGGYESDAQDMTNSVDVTLRRLAANGKCQVERVRGGQQGNRYHKRGIDSDVEDSGATKG